MLRRLPLVLALVSLACDGGDVIDPDDTDLVDDTDDGLPPPVPLSGGKPLAGAAEGVLKLPVGTPLAAFTARCGCLGSQSKQDERDSHYSYSFIESTGVYMPPTIKAVWVTNGERHLVMTKTDLGYAFDGIVEEVTRRLEEATGEDLQGQVTWSTNHSHSSYGTFSKHEAFYLGSDKFNRENFDRMAEQITAVALQAYEQRVEAALGFGVQKDWDPDNRVYSDRRGENNDLVLFDDMGPEQGGKDPYMHLLRVDEAATGDPIAVVFGWGMHPFTFSERSPLATADATAPCEMEVAEAFDEPVVAMFLQTGAGDASVRGTQSGWAKTESVGILARDAVLDLWEATPTSSEPILLETMSRSIPMNGEVIHVTRNGTVDWSYPKWDAEVEEEEDHKPDNVIYADDGSLLPDFDEWYTGYGAVFCGSGDFDLPQGGFINIDKKGPYGTCMQISFMKLLIQTFFFPRGAPEIGLPLDGASQTYSAASRLGPIPVFKADGPVGTAQGTETSGDVLLGFFPGEPVSMYTEMWRRRAKEELGFEHTALFGYSMDHEGYLLVAEDWLRGGYEPDITFWGPLSGDWIMENVLEYGKSVLGTRDLAEPFNPRRGPWTYKDHPFEHNVPDVTPADVAGTRLTNETVPPVREPGHADGPWQYWIPREFELDLTVPDEVERLDGIVQLGWIGGDPAVDNPYLTLEVEVDDDVWEPVRTHSGRVVSNDFQDFALGHTPDPLFPASADQTHYWWAVWQAVGHNTIRPDGVPRPGDRAGLPEGRYRIKVEGKRFVGDDTEYPWDAAPYTVTSDPFTVLPATLDVEPTDDGVLVALVGPRRGFRLIDIDGQPNGNNPLRGDVTVRWNLTDSSVDEVVPAGAPQGGRTFLPFPAEVLEGDLVSVEITDAYGNTGTFDWLVD